jgi:hypothetical protein
VSGSGKTHGVKSSVFRAARSHPIIVLDRMAEWDSVPVDLARRTRGVVGLREAREAVRSGARLVIVRDSRSDIEELFARACKWAIKYPGLAGVACPEAHRACPNAKPLRPDVEIAVTQWRHHKVALWVDTQRLPLLSRTVTEQATLLKLYAIVGDRDLSVVRSTWGSQCEAAVRECANRYARGEPGWHVALGLNRAPPFKLARDRL